ncbi:zinc-finger of mitochondrial splicing suppressor 51-domain-containing protein [Suillus subaureus]|uniref:Zinc-finger of mitochondrial splicing suppressor 51-domain-containing protein n=1 Tax=Suillus subaureus TaxID=48587 RepID=A0A9P7JFF5_9AGAM|nr:zinc-finger of mitochondrial splicing suppressor 51-domain-containing protein [Suillus subaureus]KAG1819578.1 zinc-finger of mitochondrial splicing suppressor 51-domain-containing protein [Suillus subaureus]
MASPLLRSRPVNDHYVPTVLGLGPFLIFSAGPSKSAQEEPVPLLTEDNLLHPFSKSPFPAIRARGEAIQSLAKCPVCTSGHCSTHVHTKSQSPAVKFECPDCGFPTHCSQEHWIADQEHKKYCSRLREVNEDDHDLRSGRKFREFEMPGALTEEAISFANWDVFWYTRGFPSMDTERSRRHASKILTYPLTIGSILHQNSGLTLSNQRVTPEGSRSLAAPDTEEAGASKPQMRIFILGARAESSLPPHAWEQLCMLFPSCHFHLFFIGPQVSLQMNPQAKEDTITNQSAAENVSTTHTSTDTSRQLEEDKPVYVPNRTRSSVELYGIPSYTVPYTPQLTITGLQANYAEVHAQFQDTFDPYTDAFFLFSPGFGFPSPNSVSELDGKPYLQIASPTEWGPVVPALLATRCAIYVTGFSPADVERDIRSIETAPDVAGEFEWVITPGENAFGSEKWEVADFDPRVMVKTNWGVWGIRGKGREVRERSSFSLF